MELMDRKVGASGPGVRTRASPHVDRNGESRPQAGDELRSSRVVVASHVKLQAFSGRLVPREESRGPNQLGGASSFAIPVTGSHL